VALLTAFFCADTHYRSVGIPTEQSERRDFSLKVPGTFAEIPKKFRKIFQLSQLLVLVPGTI